MKGFIRPDSLIGIYLNLKEAGSPSDFPQIMADVQHKLLLDAFRGFPSPYDKYCKTSDVTDFKPHNREWLSEAEDLLEITPDSPYQNTPMKDRAYSIAAKTFGRLFMLLRKTVINDDLNAFQTIPAKFGRAAKRTLAKTAVQPLETNANAYDGNALFGTRSSLANQSSTALTADATGIAAVQAGISAIKRATDPDTGEIFGAIPKYLLVSPTLESTAKWLISNTELIGSTSALARNQLLDYNLEVLVEPMLTAFPSRWYLLADPSLVPTIELAYLNGVREPELFVAESKALRASGGGRDDFGYEYDDINYKVRWDWGIAVAMYQGAYKGGS